MGTGYADPALAEAEPCCDRRESPCVTRHRAKLLGDCSTPVAPVAPILEEGVKVCIRLSALYVFSPYMNGFKYRL